MFAARREEWKPIAGFARRFRKHRGGQICYWVRPRRSPPFRDVGGPLSRRGLIMPPSLPSFSDTQIEQMKIIGYQVPDVCSRLAATPPHATTLDAPPPCRRASAIGAPISPLSV
jgi:hypothetical protein